MEKNIGSTNIAMMCAAKSPKGNPPLLPFWLAIGMAMEYLLASALRWGSLGGSRIQIMALSGLPKKRFPHRAKCGIAEVVQANSHCSGIEFGG